MIPLNIVLDAQGAYPDITELGAVSSIGRLPNGTVSGKSTVLIEVTTPDGKKVYGQTTLVLMESAIRACSAADSNESNLAKH